MRSVMKKDYPEQWSLFINMVQYVSFTDVFAFETSNNPSEPRSSLILRRHLGANGALDEDAMVWMIQGLYHEVKHLQFLETFYLGALPQFWSIRGISNKSLGYLIKLSNTNQQMPACWRPDGTKRNLSQHLFALHAFLQGMLVATSTPNLGFPKRFRDQIEDELRIVHGCFAVVELWKDNLSQAGQSFYSAMKKDYDEVLIPNLEGTFYS
jgi:hypothetical protein